MEHSFTLHELPLVIFTLLIQASIGLSFVISVVILFSKSSLNTSFNVKENGSVDIMEKGIIDIGLIRKIYGLAFLLGLIGIISSTLHLGDQFHGMYILTRIFNTALPREVVFCSAFTGCSFLIMVFLKRLHVARILLVIAPIIGLFALIFMSSFYGQMVQTDPAWDFGYTFMRFLSTIFILGGLLSAVVVITHSYTGGNIFSGKSMYATAFAMFVTGILISFIYQPSFEFYLANVSNKVSQNIYAYTIQLGLSNWLIAIGIFIALIDFALNFMRASSKQKPTILTLIAFIIVVLGLFISRDIFYALKNTQIM